MNNIDRLASRQAEYTNRANIDAQQKKAATDQLTTTFAKDSADLSGANKGEIKRTSTDARDAIGKTTGTATAAQPEAPQTVVVSDNMAAAAQDVGLSEAYVKSAYDGPSDPPFQFNAAGSPAEQLEQISNWSRDNSGEFGITAKTTLPQDFATNQLFNQMQEASLGLLLDGCKSKPAEKAVHKEIWTAVNAKGEAAKAAGQPVDEAQLLIWNAEELQKAAQAGRVSPETGQLAGQYLNVANAGLGAQAAMARKAGPANLTQGLVSPQVNPNALPDGSILPTEAFQAGGAGSNLIGKKGMTAEEAQLLQMRESDANQARTIYMQMLADRQKAEAQSRALMIQTQQDIFNILVGITTNKAKSVLATNQAWDKYIQS
jgi:hypothetical protein